MDTLALDSAPRFARLALRPVNDQDNLWLGTRDVLPAHVLEFEPVGSDTLMWPFFLTRNEIRDFFNKTVQKASQPVFNHEAFLDFTELARKAILRDFAMDAFTFLQRALETNDLTELNHCLDAVAPGSALTVDNSDLPWSFLFTVAPPDSVQMTPENFLGYRFCLLHGPAVCNEGIRIPDMRALNVFSQPGSYGFVDDPRLLTVQKNIERGVIAGYVGPKFAPLHDLGAAHPPPTLRTLDDLADYLVYNSRELVHFACDGSVVGQTGAASRRFQFCVRQGFQVDTRDLENALKRKARSTLATIGSVNAKLIFLNMCDSIGNPTGHSPARAIAPLSTSSIIGTLGRVCELAAVEIAKSFYKDALAGGVAVGPSLLRARRAALDATQNPQNLLFILSGDPDLVIAA